jgi:ATP-dependent Clp protease ATP-binding subunit ClpA
MTKKNKKHTYKVVSDNLDVVLVIKGFPLEEEKTLYEQIRSKIDNAEEPINIESYKEFVVETFIQDSDKFLTAAEGAEEEEKRGVISAAYEAIVGLYPPFSLEFICNEINTRTFMSGAHGKVLEKLQEQFLAKNIDSKSIQLSSLEEVNRLQELLKSNIVGQREAIKAIIKALKLMASGLSKHSSFLFVGPTGVGKTQMSKLLGENFSGNFFKINCAEYAGGHEYSKLIGSPPGYVGHSETSLLGEKAAASNQWVLLFDEIEKAHHKLHDFLLSILDDGTCTDNLGNVLDFSNSIFIFTSNQGISEIKQDMVGFSNTDSNSTSKKVTNEIIHNSIKRDFSPEFLNRLDDIIFFNRLTKKEVREIASLQLDVIPIKKTDALVDFVVEKGYSEEYGARNIARFIKNNISDKVADAILEKLVPKKEEEFYTPRIVKGEVKIINTRKYQTSSV